MSRRVELNLKAPAPAKNNTGRVASRRVAGAGKGARIAGSPVRGPYMPPERWYEPSEDHDGDYNVIHQAPGSGYRHILAEAEIRERLSLLPAWMVKPLQVVQLSQMTRKKRRAPCYGMQWGNTIYLYPIEQNLVENFARAPKPAQLIEAKMFGARWERISSSSWNLVWSEDTIRDFYLNNVLIHELGHILDERNTRSIDRERYAEWFALEYGYKPSRRKVHAERAAALYSGEAS
ncbi:hypothetical protein NA78x_005872 [Anatilimnocola sp. NA78]|uniref:hypothetical protein n=1 Tax=Anatilimnocola sp. NA78 TaxID=3415683 RepID=UPI003CE5BADE